MNADAAADIVLVHGGFVDGSGWRPLYDLLTQEGYQVAVVQNPTLSPQGDVAATRLIIDAGWDCRAVLHVHLVAFAAHLEPSSSLLCRGAHSPCDGSPPTPNDAQAVPIDRDTLPPPESNPDG
jgi:hypothetical protein